MGRGVRDHAVESTGFSVIAHRGAPAIRGFELQIAHDRRSDGREAVVSGFVSQLHRES
jgi:hypothetical protein